jgi:CubicO group peptidase (beta-lactamase class C family)
MYSWGTPPDGLLRTTAGDLSGLLRAFMNGGKLDGQRVLQSRTIAQILSDQHVPFAAAERTHVQGSPGTTRRSVYSGGDEPADSPLPFPAGQDLLETRMTGEALPQGIDRNPELESPRFGCRAFKPLDGNVVRA